MTRHILALFVSFATLSCFAPLAPAQRFPVEDKQTVRRTLEFGTGASRRVLDVQNVNGAIHVTGHDGSTVEMVANETIRARDQERLEAARREITLETRDRSDTVEIHVDHPGRCAGNNNSNGCFNSREDQYSVQFDFEIRMPKNASVRLRTVNGGDILVQDVAGDFDVHHVNGRIELSDISGSGRANTVNGAVQVSFASNPKSDCSFHSVNGAIEVHFRPELSAELRFKSMNGGVFTDFPAAVIPAATSSREPRVKVGNGGPEMQFETLNGAIRILQAK